MVPSDNYTVKITCDRFTLQVLNTLILLWRSMMMTQVQMVVDAIHIPMIKHKNLVSLSTRKCYDYDCWVYATLWLLLLDWLVDEIYTLALKHDFLANCAINRHGSEV